MIVKQLAKDPAPARVVFPAHGRQNALAFLRTPGLDAAVALRLDLRAVCRKVCRFSLPWR